MSGLHPTHTIQCDLSVTGRNQVFQSHISSSQFAVYGCSFSSSFQLLTWQGPILAPGIACTADALVLKLPGQALSRHLFNFAEGSLNAALPAEPKLLCIIIHDATLQGRSAEYAACGGCVMVYLGSSTLQICRL